MSHCCMQVGRLQRAIAPFTPAFFYRSAATLGGAQYRSPTTLDTFDSGGYAHDFDIKKPDVF